MATRSLIAEPYGDGWRARYVHWDGYPAGVGAFLWKVAHEQGFGAARRVLLHEHHGWSSLGDYEMPDHYDRSRFQSVTGCGIAYTREEHPSEWITHDSDHWGAEWLYIIGDAGLLVGAFTCEGVTWIGHYRWHGKTPAWEELTASGVLAQLNAYTAREALAS